MEEVIFLLVIASIYVVFAVIQDLRKREIANWINFSLIVFAFGIRFFYSLFSEDFSSFYQGLIGFGIFFILGNLLYYGRMFAGGDAKLMIALGAVLPIYPDFLSNIKVFIAFFFVFMFTGAIYGLSVSIYLSIKNWKFFRKEFLRQLKSKRKLIYFLSALGIIAIAFVSLDIMFLFFGILILISPYLYIYSKSVEESCMIKEVKTSLLTEGDWLYKNVKIGRKTIKESWEGLTKQDIKEIRKKYRKIKIKQGIPFSPVFLVSFLIFVFLVLLNIELWNSLW